MVGVIPAGGPGYRLGKAKALLDAGDGTFLERAVAGLRAVGADPVLVGVDEARGPLHAAVRAVGAHALHVAPEEGGSLLSMALDVVRKISEGHTPSADGGPKGPAATAILWLPVDLPLVRGETLRALVAEVGQTEDGSDPPALVRPTREGKPGEPTLLLPWWVRRLTAVDPTGADAREPANPTPIRSEDYPLPTWELPLEAWSHLGLPLGEVPVDDPGIHIRIGSLAEYRRRFPRVFRRRFQKW